MGGKSYYCDYCDCFMKNDINVRKKHNAGLSHTIAKTTYMRRFESPSKILAEEKAKVPCSRYWKGYCKFQLFCQYSHFSANQLAKLQKIVNRLRRKKRPKNKPRQDPNQSQLVLPLQMLNLRKGAQHKLLTKKLPPSLRPIDLQKLITFNEINHWG